MNKQLQNQLGARGIFEPRNDVIKQKFDALIELFTTGVLSPDDALKACKQIIHQHSRNSLACDTDSTE